ncbi:MAG: hypothetical protein IJW49_10910 [Clostridia bacterium]|nr:hypothetical protein [Clostridia bacterium]
MKMFEKNKKESKRISCEEMVQMVTREYVKGADEKFLHKVEKTVKGGSNLKILDSKDKNFSLTIGDTWIFFLNNRDVLLLDEKANIIYELESTKEYRNFYKRMKEEIEKERQNK